MTRAPDMPDPIAQDWPAIALVRPQMGENIGACARAMLNFGLTQLVLVEPRDRWPNPKAQAVAAGADAVLEAARLEWTLEAAIAPATLVVAATARPRRPEKPVWAPRECAQNLLAAVAAGERPIVLFGAEAMGLTTDEAARADAIVTYPVNPGFASLNLANAVAVLAAMIGETRQSESLPAWFVNPESPPATHDELEGFFIHLEAQLEFGRFYHPEDKSALMKQNLRSMFLRARMTQQECQTMRGVLKALTIGRGGRKKDSSE